MSYRRNLSLHQNFNPVNDTVVNKAGLLRSVVNSNPLSSSDHNNNFSCLDSRIVMCRAVYLR